MTTDTSSTTSTDTAPDGHPDAPNDPLTIRVSRGTGSGQTRLAAFDAALRDAGVGNFNVVRLSSVIPAGSVVKEVGGSDQLVGRHGDILYCVYAEAYASTPHSEAWAGVAWSERDDGSGAGLFVEHAGMTQTQVETDLRLTLEDLSLGRGGHYRAAGSTLASAYCTFHPVCAVVVASYRTSSWSPWFGAAGGTGSTGIAGAADGG